MRITVHSLLVALVISLASCREDEIRLFDKTADERAADAIASLKADLIAPANGWRLKYRPVDGAGSYIVLLKFNDNNKVTIKSDLSAEDGEYYSQTIGYRIDNSLGIELIFENYSFFSFLFELDQATFGAEFEFNFANKTPDNALVFTSKSDISSLTTIVLEAAAASDENLLGYTLAKNLATQANDLPYRFSSSLQLVFQNKDLILFTSLNESRRTIQISQASLKSNLNTRQAIEFSTGYALKGDSMVFDSPLQGNVLNNNLKIKGIRLTTMGTIELGGCASPIPAHSYSGVTSQNDAVKFETSLTDINGAAFATLSDFYFCPLNFIAKQDSLVTDDIASDIAGAIEFHLYYGLQLNDGTTLNAIGFVIQNKDESITFALRKFTPTLVANNIIFNFEPDITLFGNEQTDANIQNINLYLDALTQGNATYVFKYTDNIFEFHNPCSGWSFVFVNSDN